jgi:fucokinase
MKDIAENLFLRQSYAESLSILKDCINGKPVIFWDIVVITTATYSQAEIYTQLLDERTEQGLLPVSVKFLVLADRNEERIGSGGSTLYVLDRLLKDCGGNKEALLSKRCLVLHSGGDAKRLPHSSPLGKLFALCGTHIYNDLRNPPATVFDDLMVSLAGLPSRMNGGMLVVSADAFFRFNHTQIDLDTDDTVAFAMKAPVAEGTIHGVFTKKNGDGFVSEFLHKLPEEQLREHGAVYADDTVDLDVGITYFGKNAIFAMLSLIFNENELVRYANQKVKLSLYGDITYPMSGESTLDAFMEQSGDGFLSEELKALRPKLFETFHNVRLRIGLFVPAVIRNMGTSEEALLTLEYFKRETGESDFDIALMNDISANANIGDNCFIEYSVIEAGATVGDNCLISGCELRSGFAVPDNTALHAVEVKGGGWVCEVWGVYDDIKSCGIWLGRRIDKRFASEDSLWKMKLFPVHGSLRDAVLWAGKLVNGGLSDEDFKVWEKAEKLSFSDTAEINIRSLLERRCKQEDKVRADAFVNKVLNGYDPASALLLLGGAGRASRRIALITARLENGEYNRWQDEMRLYMCLAEAVESLELNDFNAERFREKGIAALREAAAKFTPATRINGAIKWECELTEIGLPIRVNWGGTWSDAPPYCFEHGGTMLNAAVLPDGKLPVYAKAEIIDELAVRFRSVDLEQERSFEKLEPLLGFRDPTDTFILYKAALSVAGVITPNGGPLKEQLRRLGGGVCVTTSVKIPKGSGLGTSSIITAALIGVLTKLTGRDRTNAELSDDVLLAEQLMTTGGGWQDAIGALYPGMKLTYTEPGIPQRYDVQQIKISKIAEHELSNRGFLLYTGQRRLARSVLRRVLSNYVCNHADSVNALNETQRLAVTMASALRRGNISGFGQLLSEHMRLLRVLDASSSNIALDYMMSGLAEITDGLTLCGAAGGGFLYGITKKGNSLADVRRWVETNYGGMSVRAYSVEIA